ncbi:hypothetical protein AQUCO_02600393v1 [Aquilegia coerulea]|uniref:Myb/SANT-like domain-containing protein n=1 Tax=Aquilegia coerulea TaxID=218851 RepID=A0A2G5D8Q4_AQUCA|nr:hypothetical protein AQUCO_02600393v1 [Aquilegia coerulea]
MAALHKSELRKRKLAAIAAVSAAATTVTSIAYILLDTTEEPNGKKARNLEAVKDRMGRMNTMIDKISKSADPLFIANKLHAELMKIEGFSTEYLNSAFQIMVKDDFEAEIFLARKIEFRKKMLEGLRDKIGMQNFNESSMKTEDKKGQLRWNSAMDNVLLDMLVKAASEGKKSGNKWSSSVWTSLTAALSEITQESVRYCHIENRVRQMKDEFKNFVELKGKSEVAYNSVKQTVNMSDDCWKEVLENPKDMKRFKAFQKRGLKWDFEKLSIIIGNSHATAEKVDVEEGKEDSHGINENKDTAHAEESMSSASTKQMDFPSSKRQHNRKTPYMNEVNHMLEGVNTHLEKLSETVDPLSFGRQLHEKVMRVEGFSQKYMNAAFRLLMKDRLEAEIFILSNEDVRKDILKDLGGHIGNL